MSPRQRKNFSRNLLERPDLPPGTRQPSGPRPSLFTKSIKGSGGQPEGGLPHDPYWYKSGVIYELHVRAFHDSDGNGVGDFRGLTEKLDYLKDLGVTALWLLPFYPSPLRDDGYDIAGYCDIHPAYGTLGDFKAFLREAHARNLRVITELVLNHTSDQHPWFQRARRSPPGSRWRDFYVWNDSPDKYKDTRIIFKDVEVSNWTWDPLADAYYWHRFFSHQPDLNFDNPEIHLELFQVIDFWLDLGVDGFRLDAIPYLYERDGTDCENLPETHAFLKKLRAHVDEKYGDRLLLAEANQWPEDAVAYFGEGKGDECHMAFHFPLMPRLFMAVRMEDRLPIVDILQQTPPIPETSQWALFLRNHDELTLETVTDEERDYMYRMYAHVHQARLNLGIRRRLAPLLGNDRKRIELLSALLLSLPGTPVLYYGDEIGMGENIYLGDRNGVRTPMQWSSDKNAGFSRGNPQSLYLPIIYDPEYHYEAVNVEGQLGNPHSLLWWMRRLLALRKRWRALGEGQCQFLEPDNRKVLAYLLRHENETLLVVANLSRFVQPAELDLALFDGMILTELFGRMEFPLITKAPYFLTLGPHTFYWFSIGPKPPPSEFEKLPPDPAQLPTLALNGPWPSVLNDPNRTRFEALLPDFLRRQAWFGGASKTIKGTTIVETIAVPLSRDAALVTLVQIDYVAGDSELYCLPIAFGSGPEADRLRAHSPSVILANATLPEAKRPGVLYDASESKAFGKALLELVANRRRFDGRNGFLTGARLPAWRSLLGTGPVPETLPRKDERRPASVLSGDPFTLKLFRRLDIGPRPALELGEFLTSRKFPHISPLAGAIQYQSHPDRACTLALVSGTVPKTRNLWEYTLDSLGRFYDRVAIQLKDRQPPPLPPAGPLLQWQHDPPRTIQEFIGTYLESARLLGMRTAELHSCLASERDDKRFAPEPFTAHNSRGLFQSMRNTAVQNLRLLRRQLKSIAPELRPLAQEVADRETEIINQLRVLYQRRISGRRIRVHGDYHLGQILWTGRDLIILNFEGGPGMPVGERRLKRSPLHDVASMVRSFPHAAWAGLSLHIERGRIEAAQLPECEPWAQFWNFWVAGAFLKAYFQHLTPSDLLPSSEQEIRLLLRAYLLSRAIDELGHELTQRPEWLHLPLRAIQELLV